ncbi:Golgi apyrase [Cladochytrium tenue]|nr:Golgi apyrase [Cladochytrium tenue]
MFPTMQRTFASVGMVGQADADASPGSNTGADSTPRLTVRDAAHLRGDHREDDSDDDDGQLELRGGGGGGIIFAGRPPRPPSQGQQPPWLPRYQQPLQRESSPARRAAGGGAGSRNRPAAAVQPLASPPLLSPSTPPPSSAAADGALDFLRQLDSAAPSLPLQAGGAAGVPAALGARAPSVEIPRLTQPFQSSSLLPRVSSASNIHPRGLGGGVAVAVAGAVAIYAAKTEREQSAPIGSGITNDVSGASLYLPAISGRFRVCPASSERLLPFLARYRESRYLPPSGGDPLSLIGAGFPYSTAWRVGGQPDGEENYGIVIDAGSSGSRIMVYSWVFPSANDLGGEKDSLPIISLASPDGRFRVHTVEPGLSSLVTDPSPETTEAYLAPLLDYARSVIPEAQHSATPVYLLATAGMRMIPQPTRDLIMNLTCEATERYSPFSTQAGCERQFRVIPGEWEGAFGWLAVNYLLPDGFSARLEAPRASSYVTPTYGFLEMGGGSVQVAVEVDPTAVSPESRQPVSVALRTVKGADVSFQVDITSILGFGVNEARKRYLEWLADVEMPLSDELTRWRRSPSPRPLSAAEEHLWAHGDAEAIILEPPSVRRRQNDGDKSDAGGSSDIAPPVLHDPCMPRGLTIYDITGAVTDRNVTGTGSLDACMSGLEASLLAGLEPTPASCDTDGDPACEIPHIRATLAAAAAATASTQRDGSDGSGGGQPLQLVGTSEFFYTPEAVFGLGGQYSRAALREAATSFCGARWQDIVAAHGPGSSTDGGGGSGGGDVGVVVDEKRLRLHCFRAAWMMTLLHAGLGVRDAADLGADTAAAADVNAASERWTADDGAVDVARRRWRRQEDSVAAPAASAVAVASLTSLVEVDGAPVGWTLGAMLQHVASTIPPATLTTVTPPPPPPPPPPLSPPRMTAALARLLATGTLALLVVLAAAALAAIGCRSMHRRRRGSKGMLLPVPLARFASGGGGGAATYRPLQAGGRSPTASFELSPSSHQALHSPAIYYQGSDGVGAPPPPPPPLRPATSADVLFASGSGDDGRRSPLLRNTDAAADLWNGSFDAV